MRRDRWTVTLLVAAGLATAGAAQAATPQAAASGLVPYRTTAPAQSPVAAFVLSDRDARPALPLGVAQTSVERKLGSQGLTGQAGFLCGRDPGHGETGAAAAYGYDPHGRFVGASLRFAFR
jgi:hypothetical protein